MLGGVPVSHSASPSPPEAEEKIQDPPRPTPQNPSPATAYSDSAGNCAPHPCLWLLDQEAHTPRSPPDSAPPQSQSVPCALWSLLAFFCLRWKETSLEEMSLLLLTLSSSCSQDTTFSACPPHSLAVPSQSPFIGSLLVSPTLNTCVHQGLSWDLFNCIYFL